MLLRGVDLLCCAMGWVEDPAGGYGLAFFDPRHGVCGEAVFYFAETNKERVSVLWKWEFLDDRYAGWVAVVNGDGMWMWMGGKM